MTTCFIQFTMSFVNVYKFVYASFPFGFGWDAELPDQSLSTFKQINRIYDGVEAETRKSQASFQII